MDFSKDLICVSPIPSMLIRSLILFFLAKLKKFFIVFVKSAIMNQLSYHVDDTKLKNEGLKLNSNLEKDIKDTLNLFNYLKQ